MEETDLLVREVKAREQVIFGDGKNPPKPPRVKEVWEEISSVVSSAFGKKEHPNSAESGTMMLEDGGNKSFQRK